MFPGEDMVVGAVIAVVVVVVLALLDWRAGRAVTLDAPKRKPVRSGKPVSDRPRPKD